MVITYNRVGYVLFGANLICAFLSGVTGSYGFMCFNALMAGLCLASLD
jgi:hypothetical protein